VTVEPERAPSSSEATWTIRRIIEWTTTYLQNHGSDAPRLEAEILLAHARNCPRINLYTHFDELLSDTERSTMRELVRRRAQSEPVAYLVGHREFFGLEFTVTPDVLIPRPDTETLVVALLELVKPYPRPRILDVGTGSGCIAIAAAANSPAAEVTAIDVSEAALGLAQSNAARHGVLDRLHFLAGDLFAPLPSQEMFHVIASNPPYVREDEWDTLPEEIRAFEPRRALLGGPDGLEIVRRLLAGAPAFLVEGGHLLVEISPEQADDVCALFCAEDRYREITVLKDLTGRSRVVHGRRTA
jgi:release factor glutamine methyltransferase